MWDHIGPIATVLMVVFNIGMVGIGVLVKFSLSRMELQLAHTEKTLNESIIISRRETDDRIEKQGREFGEVVAAIRQKVTEVELFCRDTYVRRESFYKVSEDTTKSIQTFFDKIEKRLERMEEKIDSNKT